MLQGADVVVQSMTRWVAIASFPAIGVLAGCSGSFEVGTMSSAPSSSASSSSATSTAPAVPEVSKKALEAAAKKQLQPQSDDPIDSVDCDGGLPVKVDATQTCTVTVGEDTYHATVTATEVNGTNVDFQIVIPPGQGKSGDSSGSHDPSPSPSPAN